MAKRAYETGSFQRISPEKVRLFVSAGVSLGGRRQRYTKTVTAKTDAAAERALRAFCAEISGRTGENLNVNGLIAEFMQLHAAGLSAQTQRWYQDTFKRIGGAFGKLRLAQLTPGLIEKFYQALADPAAKPFAAGSGTDSSGAERPLRNGLSPVTVAHHHRALAALLNWAYTKGYMDKRVMDRVTPPRAGKSEARALEPEERQRFLSALDAEAARCAMSVAAAKRDAQALSWRVMGRLALALGLRRGELCGLCWEDIDGNTVHVCHNIQKITGQGLVLGPLKTSGSERWLELPPALFAQLRELRAAQAEHALRFQLGSPRFVFSTLGGGPRDPNAASRYFAQIFRAAAIEGATLHSLRHTCATHLLQQGMSPNDVASYMGHSSTRMTLDVYGHAGQAMAQRCAAAAAQLLL